MRKLALVTGMVAVIAAVAAGPLAAATLVVSFPELQNPPSSEAVPLPQDPRTVGTVSYAIPPGEMVVAASVTGHWGSSRVPEGTAAVDVLVDGVVVATCKENEIGCYDKAAGQPSWTYSFKPAELNVLNDGAATMTAVQQSQYTLQLGASTLTVVTGPVPPAPIDPAEPAVPTSTPLGLLLLLAGVAAAGVWALRRSPRA
jgi:hypothetical protein